MLKRVLTDESRRKIEFLVPDRSALQPEHKLPYHLHVAHEDSRWKEAKLKSIRDAATIQEKIAARVAIIKAPAGASNFWRHFWLRFINH